MLELVLGEDADVVVLGLVFHVVVDLFAELLLFEPVLVVEFVEVGYHVLCLVSARINFLDPIEDAD